MSDKPKTRKRPDFTAYFVPDRENASWVPIGAAWSHGDTEGFNLKLDLIPNTPGRFVLRRIKHAAAEGAP